MKKVNLMMMTLMMGLWISSFAQDRVNSPVPKISTQVKGQLTKSTGWLLNPEGQWISRQNRIPFFIENKFSNLVDYEDRGLGMDNFISYQFRDIKIGDVIYTVLIKRYKDGYYKYSALKDGWTNYNSLIFYVFNSAELEKLKHLADDSINQIKISVLYWNEINWINNETYISDIEKELSRQIKNPDQESEKYLVFHVAPYKSKNLVQFQIYTSYGKYKIVSGIIKEHKIEDENSKYRDPKKIYNTDDLFNHCYYEIDYTTFSNFIGFIK